MRRVFRAHPNRLWTTEFGCSTTRLIERSFLALNLLDAAIVAVRKVPIVINIIDGSVPHRCPLAEHHHRIHLFQPYPSSIHRNVSPSGVCGA